MTYAEITGRVQGVVRDLHCGLFGKDEAVRILDDILEEAAEKNLPQVSAKTYSPCDDCRFKGLSICIENCTKDEPLTTAAHALKKSYELIQDICKDFKKGGDDNV